MWLIDISHVLHNDISVNSGLHTCWWSRKVVMELKNSCHPVTYCPLTRHYSRVCGDSTYNCVQYVINHG